MISHPNVMVEQSLCRSCGIINPVGCKLAERMHVLQALSEMTMTTFDLVKDQMEGYPGDLCRRCLSAVNTYIVFKKAFSEGQLKLKAQLKPEEAAAEAAGVATAPGILPLPESITAEVGENGDSGSGSNGNAMGEEESILPDLDLDMDFGENPVNVPQPVHIKEEKVRLISPSAFGKIISVKSEMSTPMDSENIAEGGLQEKVGSKSELDAIKGEKDTDEPSKSESNPDAEKSDASAEKESEDVEMGDKSDEKSAEENEATHKESGKESGKESSKESNKEVEENIDSTDEENLAKNKDNGSEIAAEEAEESPQDDAKESEAKKDAKIVQDDIVAKDSIEDTNPPTDDKKSDELEKEKERSDDPMEESITAETLDESTSVSASENATSETKKGPNGDDPLNCNNNDTNDLMDEPFFSNEDDNSQNTNVNGFDSATENIPDSNEDSLLMPQSIAEKEESSNLADDEESSNLLNDEDSANNIATEDLIENSNDSDVLVADSNVTSEDPFESFVESNENMANINDMGNSQNANDAFESIEENDETNNIIEENETIGLDEEEAGEDQGNSDTANS